MGRDRQATEAGILEAVGLLLARDGFTALGINAVAKTAGVDKVLIYRYFGGLPQLLAAYGNRADFWWTVEDILGDEPEPLPVASAAAMVAAIMIRHLRAVRARPITQAILAWELSERNELTEALAAVREERSLELFRRFAEQFPHAQPAAGRAVLTLLGAACNYLVARARTVDVFNGIDLTSEAGWAELESGIHAIVDATFARGTAPVPEEV